MPEKKQKAKKSEKSERIVDIAIGPRIQPLVVAEVPSKADGPIVVPLAAIAAGQHKVEPAAARDDQIGALEGLLAAVQEDLLTSGARRVRLPVIGGRFRVLVLRRF